MDDYLAKPFKQEQLWNMLVKWIKDAGNPSFELHSAPLAAAIDVKALDNIRALQRPGAPNLLDKIVSLYLADAPQLSQSMRDAIAAGDSAALQRAAHKLKSSSANLGALKLAELCKEMEARAGGDVLVNAERWFSLIEREYARVRAALPEQTAEV